MPRQCGAGYVIRVPIRTCVHPVGPEVRRNPAFCGTNLIKLPPGSKKLSISLKKDKKFFAH